MSKSLPVQIIEAIDAGDVAAVKSLFDAHPEQKDVYTFFAGKTWLHYAAGKGQREIVELLIALGMDVNVLDRAQEATPLVSAAEQGRTDVVAFLLDGGGVMETRASISNALFAAVIGRSPEVARLLIERGVDTAVRYNSPTMTNMDATSFAWMWGQREIARMIAEKHAGGDPAKVEALLSEADTIAEANTVPVKP